MARTFAGRAVCVAAFATTGVSGWPGFADEFASFQEALRGVQTEDGLWQRWLNAKTLLHEQLGGLKSFLAENHTAYVNSADTAEQLTTLAGSLATGLRSHLEAAAASVPGARVSLHREQELGQHGRTIAKKVEEDAALSGHSTEYLVQHVGSALRATIVVDRPQEILSVLSQLQMSSPAVLTVISISNGFDPQVRPASGHAAFHVGLHFQGPDGNATVLAELRLQLAALADGTPDCPESLVQRARAQRSEAASSSSLLAFLFGMERVLLGAGRAHEQGALRGSASVGSLGQPLGDTHDGEAPAPAVPLYHVRDGLVYRASLSDPAGDVAVRHANGTWVSLPAQEQRLLLIGAYHAVEEPAPLDVPQRRQLQGCSGVGSPCWINPQCCSGRCIATHRCGPPVR